MINLSHSWDYRDFLLFPGANRWNGVSPRLVSTVCVRARHLCITHPLFSFSLAGALERRNASAHWSRAASLQTSGSVCV